MNDLSKMYQVYVNKELQVNKNEILNVARLKQKTLSFLHDLGEVCQDSRCFIFWEKEEACLLYTSPSPRDMRRTRMPSSA